MTHSFSDLCLVLKRVNFGEADRILTIFTREHGKLAVVAKGIRKLTSRKAPHLELFSSARIHLVSGHNLPIVTEAQTLTDFAHLKTALQRTKHAFHLLEILDQMLAEGQPHPEVFDRLIKDLQLLSLPDLSLKQAVEIIRQFELYLLEHLGFGQPSVEGPPASFVTVNAYIESVLDRKLNSLTKLN